MALFEPKNIEQQGGDDGVFSNASTFSSPSEAAYETSEEHLWDELSRIDYLVRAQTVRWRLTIGSTKPPQLWGMVHVTDVEIESYLQSDFLPPGCIPSELETCLSELWDRAASKKQEIKKRLEATANQFQMRLEWLSRVCELSDEERDVVLVCLLPELDSRYRRLYGYLQDDVSRNSPTVDLILQILRPVVPDLRSARSLFSSESALIKNHVVIMGGDSRNDDVLSMTPVRLDLHVVNYLLGGAQLDNRLMLVVSTVLRLAGWEELNTVPERLTRLQSFADWWVSRNDETRRGATVFLHGPYGSGRLAAAQAICKSTGIPLLVADASLAARSVHPFELIVDLAYREADLKRAALCWSRCEVLLEENQIHHWDYLLSRSAKFCNLNFIASNKAWEPTGQFRARLYQRIDFPGPGYDLRRKLWEVHLPPTNRFIDPTIDRGHLAEQLANGFQLTEGQILDALDTAKELAFQFDPEHLRVAVDYFYEGCRRQSSRRLITFARRIEPRTDLTFDDLILPDPNRQQLKELRARISHRSRVYSGLGFEHRLSLGRGLIALFTGSSGTGKTMAAELLAREQGVDLYKVDLSAVVSKYVGETEKNLSRVFEEAEDANAIIFFDEADALFGKRGEVKEAQDRWANMEVNFLLQRVEEYAGVVILASNLRQNIDEAFMRRIHVIVEFPFPEAEARFRILGGLFPAGVNHPQVDELRPLTDRFKLSGGSFKNIVLDAAFRALAESNNGKPTLTERRLIAGVAREYQKLGKPITRSEFGEEYFGWIEEDILRG